MSQWYLKTTLDEEAFEYARPLSNSRAESERELAAMEKKYLGKGGVLDLKIVSFEEVIRDDLFVVEAEGPLTLAGADTGGKA